MNRTRFLFSIGWHESPFTRQALRAINLFQAHLLLVNQTGSEDEKSKELRKRFYDVLEELRPHFNVRESLASEKFYVSRLYAALLHFGANDDPLTKSLDRQLGMNKFRTTKPKLKVQQCRQTSLRAQEFSEFLPQEFPVSHSVDTLLGPEYLDIDSEHRGHWILRDPEIALLKNEANDDPW